MELEDVFAYFLEKFDVLPVPRSVAEARITSAEFQALTNWFSDRRGLPRTWCESTWQVDLQDNHGTSASRQEMFGALLIILASEACRDRASEAVQSQGRSSVAAEELQRSPLRIFVQSEYPVLAEELRLRACSAV